MADRNLCRCHISLKWLLLLPRLLLQLPVVWLLRLPHLLRRLALWALLPEMDQVESR